MLKSAPGVNTICNCSEQNAMEQNEKVKLFQVETYVRQKECTTTSKMCAPRFDKNTRHTFMVCLCICAGSVLRHFLPNALQFGECAAFSRQKAPQSLDCSTLQDGALWRGHQNAAHMVGEKQCTWRRIFKCCCGMFVAFFLTHTVVVHL